MTLDDQIKTFLSAPAFAVVGASTDPDKYGHKCFKCLLQAGRKAYPINPRAKDVLGHPTFPDLKSLPETVESISVITPPAVTEKVVGEAIAAGVKNIWMQPGAESAAAVDAATRAGLNVIPGNACLLVVLRYRE
jgi:predicted CoA-binding protein